jgi:hypothetical protein
MSSTVLGAAALATQERERERGARSATDETHQGGPMATHPVAPCARCTPTSPCPANCAYARLRGKAKFGETLQRPETTIYPCNYCADGGCDANCAYDTMTTAIAPQLFRRDVQEAMERAVIAGVKPDAVSNILRELAGFHCPVNRRQ